MSFGVEREMKESGEKGGTEDAANLQSFTKVMLRTDQDSGSDAGAGGQPISFTDAQTQNSGDWFTADSFSFGVEREMKMNGIEMSWNFSGIEGAASASTEDTEKGLTDAASVDTSAPRASGFIIEFDRPVDPSPLSGGDLADWQSNYGTGGYAAGDSGDIDLSLSAAVDTGGIPVSLPEYGLFIA